MAPRPKDVGAGLVAGAAALLTMAGVAAAGLLLLDAGRIGATGELTATVVALAAGGRAALTTTAPGELPIPLRAGVEVLPLGVTLAGAVVLGVLVLRRGRDGFGVRAASATVAVAAGLLAVAQLAGGTVTVSLPADAAAGRSSADGCLDGGGLPFGAGGSAGPLEVGYSVTGGPVAVTGAAGALAVVGVGWLVLRFGGSARRTRAGWWAVAGAVVVGMGMVAAGASGGRQAAGGVLLMLPLAVAGALPAGLGVPVTVRADGLLGCALDGAAPMVSTTPLRWVSGAALLALGVLVTAKARRQGGRAPHVRTWRELMVVGGMAVSTGAGLAAMTLLTTVNVDVGVGGLDLLDAGLGADPAAALAVGAAVGAVAGAAGVAVVRAAGALSSLPWRPWKDRARP
ncbi:hypothetical protein [Jiangella sp. DSM 45060]|uniref:hypothetical protein n=1 Tax=Jiangella sp. DSM 45060 TaxID=1798224 RepID=UPI00087D3C57|nr:hypothetical protein [Jiangella sp. DSM 45060]SDT26240.1 hypothetical protein SAMN04515669_3299 [Jiangella sp. DSM 45060]